MPAVNIISALPSFISQEEYQTLSASTPQSFSDIPPILKHKEENVKVSLDPPLPEISGQDGESGTLYVLTSALTFFSNTGKGFQIEYPTITLHAVSRGAAGPSIYCQLDESLASTQRADEGEDADSEMRELSIIPQNAEAVEPIFEALSHCASLHPDPLDEEGDLDDAFIDSSNFETFNGDEDEELSEVGKAALAHLESIIYDPHKLKPDLADNDDDDNNVTTDDKDAVSSDSK